MERGREGEGRANKHWNFIWAQQSLSLSLALFFSVSVSVSCSGPLLLSQADFIAGPWTSAKQANSVTMWACTCVCICPCMQPTARKCLKILEATQSLNHFGIPFACTPCLTPLISICYLSVFSFYYFTDYFSSNGFPYLSILCLI